MKTKLTDWLTPDNAALVLVDHQAGISGGVADMSQTEFQNNVVALAKIGKIFNLPVIITTSDSALYF